MAPDGVWGFAFTIWPASPLENECSTPTHRAPCVCVHACVCRRWIVVTSCVWARGCGIKDTPGSWDAEWDGGRWGFEITFLAFGAAVILASMHFAYVLPYMARYRLGRFSDPARWYCVTAVGADIPRDSGERVVASAVASAVSSTTASGPPPQPLLRRNAHQTFKFKFEYYPLHPVLDLITCRMLFWTPLLRRLRRPALLTYTGELDGAGRPHGYGRWRDGQSGGESLRGLWQHGVPIGPFICADQSTGFSTRSTQIGYATCCLNATQWDADSGTSDLQLGPLHWGLATTETSVSGHFYSTPLDYA